METVIKHFSELSNSELYDTLRLRSEVFVVEQDCVYQDMDGNDAEAFHIFIKDGSKIIACLRVFREEGSISRIGRVVVDERHRREGLATKMLKLGIEAARREFGAGRIVLDAQTYALGLYEGVGFRKDSDEFLEDGIPHYRMSLDLV